MFSKLALFENAVNEETVGKLNHSFPVEYVVEKHSFKNNRLGGSTVDIVRDAAVLNMKTVVISVPEEQQAKPILLVVLPVTVVEVSSLWTLISSFAFLHSSHVSARELNMLCAHLLNGFGDVLLALFFKLSELPLIRGHSSSDVTFFVLGDKLT